MAIRNEVDDMVTSIQVIEPGPDHPRAILVPHSQGSNPPIDRGRRGRREEVELRARVKVELAAGEQIHNSTSRSINQVQEDQSRDKYAHCSARSDHTFKEWGHS